MCAEQPLLGKIDLFEKILGSEPHFVPLLKKEI
jgi:hypothetical protein